MFLLCIIWGLWIISGFFWISWLSTRKKIDEEYSNLIASVIIVMIWPVDMLIRLIFYLKDKIK